MTGDREAVRQLAGAQPVQRGGDGGSLEAAPVAATCARKAAMRVWIDQDLCTGDGLCVDHCPEVFVLLEDGISYVVDEGRVCHDPGGPEETAAVPDRLVPAAIAAAEDCPGECIFLEVE